MDSPSKSPVWRYFKIDSDNSNVAICQLCLKSKSESESKVQRKNNTTNLWKHLEMDHNDEYKSLKGNEERIVQAKLNFNSQNKPSFTIGCQSKIEIDRYIAELIVTDCQPLRIVEENGFKNLVKFSFPNYELPGREYFKNYVQKMYTEAVENVRIKLQDAEYLSLTSDLWTSISNETYISITAHYIDKNGKMQEFVLDTKPFGSERHTSQNISLIFEATISKWNFEKKIVAIVTDNAKNIVNAVNFTDNLSICCSAHTLQLAIKDAFSDQRLDMVMSKCKSIVSHFKHSSQSFSKLSNIQKRLNLKQHKLIQEVSTRWNTSYYMLERLFEQKSALNLFSSENSDIDLPQLNNQEWRIVDGLINVLEPLESATRILSGDKYCNISLIIPLITGLVVRLKMIKSSESDVNIFKEKLVVSLKSRFKDIEHNSTITTATFLDPRVKDTCFSVEHNKRKAFKHLLDILKENSKSDNSLKSTSSVENPPPNKRSRFSLIEFIKEQQHCDDSAENQEYSIELDTYLKQPVILKNNNNESDEDYGDILDWWEKNKFCFPNLYILSKKYLCIPATSTPCERIFSKAGEIISKKRSRLKPKNFNCLLFLMHNLPKLKLN